MPRTDLIEFTGTVIDMMGGGFYNVQLDNNTTVRAYLTGKMKQNKITVIDKDQVVVAVSPYDTSHGIIIRKIRG